MGIGFLWQTGTQPTSLLLLDAMHSIIIDAATHSTLKGKQAVLLESTSDASKFTGGANLVIDMPVQVISTGVAAVEISTEAGQDRSVGPVNVFGPGRIETQGATSPSMSVDLVGGKGKKGDDDDIGNGDKGNAGGTVGLITLNSDQTIPGNSVWELSTTGNSSPGIMINAQGGEGGGGGAGLNNGGGGNTGGTGGGVSVGGPNASNNYGPATLGITTQGQQSPAISVVSTGGNGGEGHSGDGGNGGNGGHGGPGGAISVVLDSSTGSTTHKESPAIVAVSNGGDGGKGGGSPTGTGGNGGVGRGGGAIEVTLTGKNTILTGGSDSDAISAYSIGGQGGKGGSGGWLGPGGNGDVVTLTNTSSVATSGNGAKGLFAQSIGGAGGAGGSSVAIVGIGGNGGAASKGNSVTITNSGDISTGTTAATGPANANDSCETGCSAGIMAQSIGGAGGDGSGVSTLANATVLVNLGGGSGSTGNGGTVEVDHFASEIQTTGVGSVGIFAQSVGGGGGKAATGIVTASHSINLGGTGGGSGAGGSVTVNVSGGSINTGHGATAAAGTVAAHGVVAQSVGGGGGYAGNVKIGAESNFGTDLAMNANGTDTSGNGGDVAVTIAGPVTTWGQSSLGVFAQSVGGGGVKGDGGTPAADALVGSGGGSGNSGTVMVTTSANITAHGKHAHAIFAQGAAGKAGTAGDMTISVNGGKVSALRDGGHGILAQNLGTGSGEISVTVAKGGTVSGGGDATEQGKADGAGIYINPSASSTITNQGTIESSLGSTGTAILFTGLSGVDLQVANSGTITGEICKNGTCSPGSAPAGGATITLDNAETGVGTITLNNAEAGVIVTGNLLDVNALSNRGTIDLGGADRILSTRHQGDFVHHETGKVLLDLDARQNLADQAAITGVADLAGKAVMTVNDAGRPSPGTR